MYQRTNEEKTEEIRLFSQWSQNIRLESGLDEEFRQKSTKKKIVAGLVGAAFLGIGTVSSVSASGLLASAYGNAVREQAVVEEASVA